MYLGYRVRNFRVRHGSWQQVHHHMVGGVNTAAAWERLGGDFGDLSMEAILVCRVSITLNTIWYTTYKIKTV